MDSVKLHGQQWVPLCIWKVSHELYEVSIFYQKDSNQYSTQSPERVRCYFEDKSMLPSFKVLTPMKVMTIAMKDFTWIITRKYNQGDITDQRDLWIPSTSIVISLDWLPTYSFSYLPIPSSPFPPDLQFPLFLPYPLQTWIQHCLQSCSSSHEFTFLQQFLYSLNDLSKTNYHQQETLALSTFRTIHEMLGSFCQSRILDKNEETDNSSRTHTIHIIPLRRRHHSLSFSLQPTPTPTSICTTTATTSISATSASSSSSHNQSTVMSTLQQLEYFSIQIQPPSSCASPAVRFCIVTFSGVYAQQLRLHIGKCYTLHNLCSISSPRPYPSFHFTSSSSIQRCSIQSNSSSVQYVNRLICTTASLLSGVSQTIHYDSEDGYYSPWKYGRKGWREEVDAIVMEAKEYSQLQHMFINHLRDTNILHTPISLLDQIQSSSSYWLIGMVVDCITTTSTSLIRLRDLNTDTILQLQCPSHPERFSLWEVVLFTDVQVDINIQERYVIVSPYSSMFVVPQTGFLHAALSYCPQRADWRLLSCLFEWRVVEVERVLSFKACQVCPRCMQAIINRPDHLRNCGLPELDDLPIYLECTFFGISDFMQIKGTVRGDAVWKLLRISPSVQHVILSHVKQFGAWTDWRQPDLLHHLSAQQQLEIARASDREHMEMYVSEQDECSIQCMSSQIPHHKQMNIEEGEQNHRFDLIQLNKYIGRIMVLAKRGKKGRERRELTKVTKQCKIRYDLPAHVVMDIIDVKRENSLDTLQRLLQV